jgi:hypothetical protein
MEKNDFPRLAFYATSKKSVYFLFSNKDFAFNQANSNDYFAIE